MQVVPQNDCILCECISPEHEKSVGAIEYEVKKVPIYKILALGSTLKDCKFEVGDNIIFQTNGTKVTSNSKTCYLFKAENIIGKVS